MSIYEPKSQVSTMSQTRKMFIKRFYFDQIPSESNVAVFSDNDILQPIIEKLEHVNVTHNRFAIELRDVLTTHYVIVSCDDFLLTPYIYNNFIGPLLNVTIQEFDNVIRREQCIVLDLTKRHSRDIQDILYYADVQDAFRK